MNEKRIYWIGATIVLAIMVVCGIVTGISYFNLNNWLTANEALKMCDDMTYIEKAEQANLALIGIWRWVIGVILYQIIYIPVSIQAFKKEEKQNDC